MRWFIDFFSNNKKDDAFYEVCKTQFEVLNEINRVGYAVINLIDKNKHTELLDESVQFLEKIKIHHPSIDFLSLGRSHNHQLINESKIIIEKHLSESINTFFSTEDFDIMYGTHLLKSTNKNAALNPHQDSSHVDENSHASYYIWIPISQPTRDFGTLEVIPFSHNLHIPYRSLNIPWTLMEHEMILWKFMKKIYINAGQAVVFDSKMVHASGLNKTNTIRIAANIMIKPKDADMIHFYSDETSNFTKIELHKINSDFYYNQNIMERPKGYPLLKIVENTNRKYTLKELKSIFKNQ